jgi:hypothetical protein
MKQIRLAGLALLVAAISGSDATAPRRQISDLAVAKMLWRAQNLHTYAFTLQQGCFCANVHPLYVAVVNDAVAGVIDLETGDELDPQAGETVDDLFAFIERARDRHAQLIRVRFDPMKGFPSEIDYDGAAGIADDEITYRASDVHPIPPRL